MALEVDPIRGVPSAATLEEDGDDGFAAGQSQITKVLTVACNLRLFLTHRAVLPVYRGLFPLTSQLNYLHEPVLLFTFDCA